MEEPSEYLDQAEFRLQYVHKLEQPSEYTVPQCIACSLLLTS